MSVLDGLEPVVWGACMKIPYQGESPAKHHAAEFNMRRGPGRTRQVAYPCAECGAGVWHTTTEKVTAAKAKRRRRTVAEFLKGEAA